MQLGPLLLPGPKKLDGPAWADAYERTKTTDFKGVPSDFSALSGEFDSVGEALGPRRVRWEGIALQPPAFGSPPGPVTVEVSPRSVHKPGPRRRLSRQRWTRKPASRHASPHQATTLRTPWRFQSSHPHVYDAQQLHAVSSPASPSRLWVRHHGLVSQGRSRSWRWRRRSAQSS
jgi:hypothetical protein